MSDTQEKSTRRSIAWLAGALCGGLLLRLGTWPQVFLGGRTWIDGPDGYYHLRRAWLTLGDWPRPPQTDMLIGVPEGGPISWPPLFDLLLATLALPWKGTEAEALERVGALLPPLVGMLEIVVLFLLVRRLFGETAAGWSAIFAAILPGVSRYSLLGSLDHDPLVETLALVALFGLAGGISRPTPRRSDTFWFVTGATLLTLTWAGALLHLALLPLLVLVVDYPELRSRRRSAMPVTLGTGALLVALATLPFVLSSVWTERMGATFIGLSWLHTSALLGLALAGFAMALWLRPERRTAALLGVSALGFLGLVVSAWPAFRDGFSFFVRGEPFLQGVMESRPLLSLFGGLDLRAPIVRLSLLPFLIPVVLPWSLRRWGSDRRIVFLWVWLLYMTGIALIQSRYAHAAALPMAALAGVLVSHAGRMASGASKKVFRTAVVLLVVVPSLPAYLSIPGLEPFRFFGRLPKIVTTGMNEACDFLREEVGPAESWADPHVASSSAVLAPWSAGHWLIWSGRQGTVATPLGPQGQPAFADGIRFYLESDLEAARRLLDRHRVRYFVATAEVPPVEAYAGLAGVDPGLLFSPGDGSGPRALDAEKYLATIAARLTWIGTDELDLFGRQLPALDEYREVFRSRGTRPNPFARLPLAGVPAEVPLVRVFAVADRGGETQAKPGRSDKASD